MHVHVYYTSKGAIILVYELETSYFRKLQSFKNSWFVGIVWLRFIYTFAEYDVYMYASFYCVIMAIIYYLYF